MFARASAHRARAWSGGTEAAIDGLIECIQAHRVAGQTAEADGLSTYLVEVLVLAGRFPEAIEQADLLLTRSAASSSQEVVVLTTRRLAAVALPCPAIWAGIVATAATNPAQKAV
jgi:hypothetical protein